MNTPDNPCLTCPDTCCALKGNYGLMLPVYESRGRVKFMLYMTPDCVADRRFQVAFDDARKLVEAFCRSVYGEKTIIIQVYKDSFWPKLQNRCAKLFFNQCAIYGVDW